MGQLGDIVRDRDTDKNGEAQGEMCRHGKRWGAQSKKENREGIDSSFFRDSLGDDPLPGTGWQQMESLL